MNFLKLFFLLIIFFTLHAKEDKLEPITLQLQWKHQFEFAGFYVAKEMGYYKDIGLDVSFKEYEKDIDIVDEVLDGNAHYGLSYSSIIAQYLNGKPIVFIANFFKQSPLVLITQKNIKKLSDLKNKKVMGISNSIDNITLVMMLEKFNISMQDIQTIPPSFNLDMFINKKIAAMSVFTTNELYDLDKKGISYNLFDPTVYGALYYDVNLFTSKEELQKHPQRVKEFKEASIKGWEYALENRDKTIKLIIEKYNSQQKTADALHFEAKQIENLMLRNVYDIGSIDSHRVKVIADSFRQSGFIKKGNYPDLQSFIYDANSSYIKLSKEEIEYLKERKEFDYTTLIILLSIIFIFMIFGIYRYSINKKLNKELTIRVDEALKTSRDKDQIIFQQNKLSAMGEMIENIAHQWRQPLSQINSVVLVVDGVLTKKNIHNDTLEEKLLEIESLTQYMSQTIDDFKDFFSQDKKKEIFVLDVILDNTISMARSDLMHQNIELKLNLDKGIAINGYPRELQQVILVIINNAKDILIERKIPHPYIKISASQDNGNITIRIQDNAGGVDNDIIDKIFDPYFTTKQKTQGTGLGLYISQMLIKESMNGILSVKNRDAGACFYITLGK
ncbi:MAG: ABC transporter substrate-binding protein [Campylobacterota bacterium]|nr:ABC transporter substrate-binding protein [Campylobacterota bacterium]